MGQLGGLLGVVGVVLFVIGVIMEGDAPVYTAGADEIRTFFVDNGDTYLLADFIIGIAVVFCLVPFFAVVRSVMQEAEGPGSLWPMIGFTGAVLWVLTGAFSSVFTNTLALSAEAIEDDGAIVALATAGFYAFNAPGFVIPLFFLAMAMGIMRTNVFAAPIGWLCLVLAVVGILSGLGSVDGDPEGAFAMLGLVAGLGLAVVVLLIGGSLFMRKES